MWHDFFCMSNNSNGKDAYFYHPPTTLWEGNIFTHVCVCSQGEGIPMWPLLMMHWTSLYSLPAPSDTPLLVTSSRYHRRPVQTCLLRTPTCTDIWWPKYIRLTIKWYASYWSVFLFFRWTFLRRINQIAGNRLGRPARWGLRLRLPDKCRLCLRRETFVKWF